MSPGEILALVVEVNVAIAGFSGIVVVVGHRGFEQWKAVDRLRLQGLLNTSVSPMAISGLGLVLLASQVPSETVWRICSGAFAAVFALFVPYGMRRAASLEPEAINRAQMVSVGVSGVAIMSLLTANAVSLHAFWPLALGLAYNIGLALMTFFGLLQRVLSDDRAV